MITRRLAAVATSAWPYLLVLALAATARGVALDRIDYRYDEAAAVRFGFDIADGRFLWFAPHSGSVAPHFALSLYVNALAAVFARDPMWVAACRGLMDVFAAGLLMWGLRRALGRAEALGAGALYATAPWVVYFARKTWVSPLSVAAAMAVSGAIVFVACRDRRGWWMACLGVLLAIGSHLSAAYLLVGLAVAAALGWRTLGPRRLLIGVAPIAMLMVGYGVVVGLPMRFASAALGTGWSVNAPLFGVYQTSAFRLGESTGLHMTFSPAGSPLESINIAPMALLLAGIGLSLVGFRPKRADPERRAALVALAFWGGVVVTQIRPSVSEVGPHHVSVAIPAAFVLMGMAVGRLRRAMGDRWRWAAGAGLAAVVAYQSVYVMAFASAASGSGPFPGYRPLSLARSVTEAARTLDVRCGGSGEILIAAPGADPWVDDWAAVFSTLLEDRRPRIFSFREAAIVPAGCATWVIAPGDAPALRAFDVPAGPAAHEVPAGSPSGEPLGIWEHGAALEDVIVKPGGVGARLRVDANVAATGDVHWTARVLRGGTQVAASDLGGVMPRLWRAGDRLWLWFALDPAALTPPPTALRIGSYRYPELDGIGVRLPNGTWTDAVTVPVHP